MSPLLQAKEVNMKEPAVSSANDTNETPALSLETSTILNVTIANSEPLNLIAFRKNKIRLAISNALISQPLTWDENFGITTAMLSYQFMISENFNINLVKLPESQKFLLTETIKFNGLYYSEFAKHAVLDMHLDNYVDILVDVLLIPFCTIFEYFNKLEQVQEKILFDSSIFDEDPVTYRMEREIKKDELEENRRLFDSICHEYMIGTCSYCFKFIAMLRKDIREAFINKENYEMLIHKDEKRCVCKKYVDRVMTRETTNYYIVYNNKIEINVSREAFKNITGKVVYRDGKKFKYHNQALPFNPPTEHLEGVNFEGVFDLFNGASNLIQGGMSGLKSLLDLVSGACSHVSSLKRYSTLVFNLFTPLVSSFALIQNGLTNFSLINAVALVSNIMTMCRSFKEFEMTIPNKTATAQTTTEHISRSTSTATLREPSQSPCDINRKLENEKEFIRFKDALSRPISFNLSENSSDTDSTSDICSTVGDRFDDIRQKEKEAILKTPIIEEDSESYNKNDYKVFSDFISTLPDVEKDNESKVVFEMWDAFTLAGIHTMLPPFLSKIVEKMSVYTSCRLLDDTLFYQRISKFISMIIYWILNFASYFLPEFIIKPLYEFMDLTSFGRNAYLIMRMESITKKYLKSPQLSSNMAFQTEFIKVHEEYTEVFKGDFSYFNRNSSLKNLLLSFNAVYKLIKANQDTTRIEPICIILQGPPRCGKSQTLVGLDKILRAANKSVYVHTTPNVKTAKDFYDDYNGQDVFMMDDVGQMGGSQWTSVVNLVSPVKYSLPCANAELKQTKFMSSQMLICTTNSLSGMQFQRDDGIADPTALFRRCEIIDYADARVVWHREDQCFRMTGQATYHTYDLEQQTYIHGFTQEFQRMFPNTPTFFDFTAYKGVEYETPYYRWILDILSKQMKLKKSIKDLSDRLVVDDILKDITFEGWFDKISFKDVVNSLFDSNINGYFKGVLHRFLNYAFDLDTVVPNYSLPNSSIGRTFNFLINVIWFYGFYYTMYNLIECASEWMYGDDDFLKSSYNIIKKQVTEKMTNKEFQKEEDIDPFVRKIQKHVKYFGIVCNDPVTGVQMSARAGHCLVSGGNLITNAHFIKDAMNCRNYITVYSDYEKKMIMYDQVPIEIIYMNKSEDVAIFGLPKFVPSLLPDVSELFSINKHEYQLTPAYMISNHGIINIKNRIAAGSGIPMSIDEDVSVHNNNSVRYDIGSPGLCGTPIISDKNKIIGMHTGGFAVDGCRTGHGLAMVWSSKVKTVIYQILQHHKSIRYNLEVHENNGKDDCSVVKMNNIDKVGNSIPTGTKYVHSLAKGIYPEDKVPANLGQKNIIKDLAKKSYKPLKPINDRYLNFATSYIRAIVPKFTKVTEQEVVHGIRTSKGINKDTSCGFGLGSDKNEHIDFVNGTYKPEFSDRIQKLKNDIIRGEVDYKDVLYCETLKDELRLVEKKDKPRCFKMSPLTLTCLGREYFLDLIEKLSSNRMSNGIMVGVNPFTEWGKLADKANKYGGCIVDGDYKEYDGSMIAPIQLAVSEILLDRFVGNEDDKKICTFLLSTLIYCLTLNMNEILLTTHSCPSGSFITAVYNCIINKSYGAYIFSSCWDKYYGKMPILTDYVCNVFDAVYGDDKWCIARKAVLPFFNGVTFQEECAEIGLTFTSTDKSSEMLPFKNFLDTSFLKRNFAMHPTIGGITCPLDKTTMTATLNYVSDKERLEELTIVKLLNFQREAYLHDEYESYMNHIEEFTKEHNIEFVKLTDDYLRELYMLNPEEYSTGLLHDF